MERILTNASPLVARRRGAQPKVTPIGDPELEATADTSAESSLPPLVQPVGGAPATEATGAIEKAKVQQEEKDGANAQKESNSGDTKPEEKPEIPKPVFVGPNYTTECLSSPSCTELDVW